MRSHRFLPEQTRSVADEDARSALERDGVPVEGILSEPDPDAGTAVEMDGAILLRVSRDRSSGGLYVVDAVDGSVHLADLGLGERIYVNRSPGAFAGSLAAFEAAVDSQELASGDLDDAEHVAERFRSRLLKIDPTALRDETGFWGTLVFDIANGDYS